MKENIVVQKFGGSSMATIEKIKEVADYVKKTAGNKKVIVVVSAMGDETDKLKQLAQKVCGKRLPLPSELDKLLATGEEQSASLLAMAIGGKAISLTGFQIKLKTDGVHGEAKIKGIQNISKIKRLLDKGKIVVVAGFQGVNKKGNDIVTLGQGGSDLTAIALAGSLRTKCEIYTDVDGIFTVDPRIVSKAKRFKKITYSQMLQLSSAGAGVLMDRCVLLAQNLGVEIKVLLSPSFGKTIGGTLVYSGSTKEEMEGLSYHQAGIAVQKEIALVKITNIPNKPGMAEKVFESLNGINIVDTIQEQGERTTNISILVQSEDLPRALLNLEGMEEVKTLGDSEMATLTLIDPAMKEQPGYFYRVSKSLAKAEINIEMLSSSGIAILVVVQKENLKKASLFLAKEFDLLE